MEAKGSNIADGRCVSGVPGVTAGLDLLNFTVRRVNVGSSAARTRFPAGATLAFAPGCFAREVCSGATDQSALPLFCNIGRVFALCLDPGRGMAGEGLEGLKGGRWT